MTNSQTKMLLEVARFNYRHQGYGHGAAKVLKSLYAMGLVAKAAGFNFLTDAGKQAVSGMN